MDKSILVTGSAGFIGSRVAALLVKQGHHVVGIDNMNNYYDVSLKQHRLHQLERLSGFDFRQIDLENGDAIQQLFEAFSFESVINLAARAGVRYSMENPRVYMTTNALGSLNLLEEIRKHEISKYMLASTSSLYAGQTMPFTEDLEVNTPISSYAASKKSAEMMAYSHHFLYGIDVSICRYFTVYGPAGRPDMCIFRFIKWIDQEKPIELFGDGTQSRDFTFVDDIARGTIAALKPVGYEVFNLGGGNQPISLNTIIEKLETLLGKKARIMNQPFHKADIDSTWADISKAKQQLEWEPHTGLDEGLEQCVRWYRDNLPWSGRIRIETPCI
ncbi:MAG: SDR family NAD(P)-dependent oxidoreductase [Mariniblastus sp.]|nr:SDR family NAD(P)-dependent oxidoreductase [Mariniblastus sp.]